MPYQAVIRAITARVGTPWHSSSLRPLPAGQEALLPVQAGAALLVSAVSVPSLSASASSYCE